ncbi:MAG: hypothetical protein J6Q65_08790, partial [Lentisphaeria bacterium]|nr:hypothetical protein [Lentisphaeria bacterium]
MFRHRFTLPLAIIVFMFAFAAPLFLCGGNESSAPAAVVTAVSEVPAAAAAVAETADAKAAEEAGEVMKEEKSRFAGTYWALIPPLLAIVLALITKEVYSSLFIGVLLGGVLAAE